MQPPVPVTETAAWRSLASERDRLAGCHLRDLFATDAARAERFAIEAAGLFFDYSKHRIDAAAMNALLALAREREVEAWRERMFRGERINTSEDRAVLHVALRRSPPPGEVAEALERMRRLADDVHAGRIAGATGERIRAVVNIGIGGSDLGPRMAVRALRAHRAGSLDVRFVANVDPADLDAALVGLDAATTLFVVTSKTFTTVETLDNARRARAWLASALGAAADLSPHFVAVTSNVAGAQAWGARADRILPMWDWVGGRYSLWSAVGLPIALALGMAGFERLLAGARAMDDHFNAAPLERNIPVVAALLGVWCTDFLGAQSHAVLPYSEDLRDFPAYLQQLEMESNGKRVDRAGQPVGCTTSPVVWGASGTNGQHAFHQLLHQGTLLVPCDFIVPAEGAPGTDPAAHRLLVANALAQSAALMLGMEAPDAPARAYPGNQPSTTIVMPRLTPEALGALIALYEHKVFVQGAVWGINSFDQWGVELGKAMAKSLAPALAGGATESLDASTRQLVARLRSSARH